VQRFYIEIVQHNDLVEAVIPARRCEPNTYLYLGLVPSETFIAAEYFVA
jgi:hypothetical protein